MTDTVDHKSRAHALLSASSSHRWLNCPGSAAAALLYESQDTSYTREGTLAHEVAEQIAKGEPVEAYGEVTKEMVEHARAYADYIQELTESADDVVLLEERVDFSRWVPDGFGTCDCILIHGDTLKIVDYKYGMGVPVSAENNSQMRLYALGAVNDFGFAYQIEHIEMHIFQPRIKNISDDSMTLVELLDWATNVAVPAAKKAVGKGRGKNHFKAGVWCRFCPHTGKCRTLANYCTETVKVGDVKVKVPVLPPWQIAEIIEKEPIITMWLKRVKAQALDDLLNGGTLPGYKVVEGKQGNRKWTDELAAARVLEGAGYNREDFTEVKLLSPAAMDKAIGRRAVAELLDGYIDRAAGLPIIVSDNDIRPTYNRADDFTNLEE